jgi:Zn-finger nucleic acid-binding protein
MNCPACRSPMEELEFHAVTVDQCSTCCGVWLDHREIDELFGQEELPARLLDEDQVQQPDHVVPEGHRTCPRCKTFLKLVQVDGISLDVCSECKGFWADLGELEGLAAAAERRFQDDH